jgi:arylsulfatase A-like enzyme
VDLYPTLLDVAGASPPADYPLDGESLLPLLRGERASLEREAIYQHFPGYLGSGPGQWRTTPVGLIQAGDWKLMEFYEDHRLELYNLREDAGETKNLADEMPEKAKQLHAQLVAWRTKIGAPMPTPNQPVEEPTESVESSKKKAKKR